MSEPKPIAVHMTSKVPSFRTGFYKLDQHNPLVSDGPYLYDNGDIGRPERSPRVGHIGYAHSNFHNEGQLHPDDWCWNKNEQRMKEMSTLSEEEYLEVSMSDAIRITISEWDEVAYSKAVIAFFQDLERQNWKGAIAAKENALATLIEIEKKRSQNRA